MILHTERLLLRDFHEDDWRAMHAYQNDPRFLRFDGRELVGELDACAQVDRFVGWAQERPRTRVQLAITLEDGGDVIGNVGLRRDGEAWPVADMGYELAPAHWGRGYAVEAGRALLDWGFGRWGLDRAHAHCIAENAASAAVLRRLGMRPEGTLRAHQLIKGRFYDVLLFGILREEWEAHGGGR
ncbi:MAG TPA: GNAT family protein [Longimicrobium sp.]|nr:GNAT family protein [Longimicrobium sp.]